MTMSDPTPTCSGGRLRALIAARRLAREQERLTKATYPNYGESENR